MEPDIENAIFIDKQVYLKFLENKFWKLSAAETLNSKKKIFDRNFGVTT